jgi:uncharacterized LabA/DUF88 family protein
VGLFVSGALRVAAEPLVKRAVAFIDGQNLFHAVRNAFGYTFPNYDVLALSRAVCAGQGWQLDQVRFYTGIPAADDDARWKHFWSAKLLAMSRQGVITYSRPLRYRNQRVRCPDGSEVTYLAAEEKGVDVRIALDIIRMAHRGDYDVALVFSQDQDLSEAAQEVRVVAKEQNRWIKRGINATDWIRIERATYDACRDPRDYRPRNP